MSTEYGNEYVELLSILHRADLLSRRAADRFLIEQIGIGRSMFMILDILGEEPSGVSQQAIASALGLTKAAVSRHVQVAEANHWLVVRPSPASRRQKEVTLTAAGRRLVDRGRRRREDATRRAVRTLGSRDLKAATRTLERLCAYLHDRSETA